MLSTVAASREERGRPANVSACLDALDDDDVAADLRRAPRLVDGSDLPPCERARVVYELHELAVGVRVEELDEPRTRGRQADVVEGVDLPERRDEVHAEGGGTGVRELVEAFA